MRVLGYRERGEGANATTVLKQIIDIKEATYSGKDMGERSITATIKWPSVIDFRIGDFVVIEMSDLSRVGGCVNSSTYFEYFYIYTQPTIKKISSSYSAGDAFEHTVTFFPAQYELGTVMMRDIIQQQASSLIYTGYDEFSFYGGANTLMKRIMAVLDERFGANVWSYSICDDLNEDINTALEKYQFDFSSNTVWDALAKLNDEDGINTTFYVNKRHIYVGYKNPIVCNVDKDGIITPNPYIFHYGKSSHLPIEDTTGGGLFNITKAVGTSSPITRLYAYGDTRNINRFYCADRLKSGRYVNHLMLPQFDNDGKTDYIDAAQEQIDRYGIREGKKNFDEIYPSLRYITYGDLRTIKYVLKIKGCGLEKDKEESNVLSDGSYPVARVQCYKVEDAGNGKNKLVESYPDKPLVVCIHATGKVCKVILGTSEDEQKIIDGIYHLPKYQNNTIEGSCFCVHQGTENGGVKRFDNYASYVPKYAKVRDNWFVNVDSAPTDWKDDISHFQINYTDDPRITDVYVCEYNEVTPLYEDQTVFSRDGYSAYCWPRINKSYPNSQSDSIPVSDVVKVSKVTKVDTDLDYQEGKIQQTFDVYLKDVGFKINEQTPFGTMVHIVGQTFNLQFTDGDLAGVNFEVAEQGITGSNQIESVCCLYNEDGNENTYFKTGADDVVLAQEAISAGAIWRITVKRSDSDFENYGIILPNMQINAAQGDKLVFLNIYMPDIYVHAAENALLKEAQKYLNDNKNGDISYTTEFDKIRLLQIPNLGIQMREGAVMRIKDADLDINTDNDEVYLFKNTNVQLTRTSALQYTQSTSSKRVYTIINKNNVQPQSGSSKRLWKFAFTIDEKYNIDWDNYPIDIKVKRKILDVGEIESTLIPKSITTHSQSSGYTTFSVEVPEDMVEERFVNEDGIINETYSLEINCYEEVQEHSVSGSYNSPGRVLVCGANPSIEFRAGKHYTIVVDVETSAFEDYIIDGNICLCTNLSSDNVRIYKPTCTKTHKGVVVQGYDRYEVSFDLPDAFNDSITYNVCIRCETDGETEMYPIGLISVLQSNINASGEKIDYVDLTIDQITIKLSDSGNEYSVGGTSSRAASSPGVGVVSNDDKQITATVKNNKKASSWQYVNSKVEKTAIQGNNNATTIQSIVQSGRQNTRRIDALKGSIFDPDGTIKDTFLQTMMLQVGSDSMNFFLEKTKINADGSMDNIAKTTSSSTDDESGETAYYSKLVFSEYDILHHYTAAYNGNWLAPNGTFENLDCSKTYYLALKCERAGSNATWVCEETQHKVDELDNYWYFNWGILLPEYTEHAIVETRGNAYMYGDNLIAGKIKTINGNSFFDLTGNTFKLGNKMSFDGENLRIGSLTTFGSNFVSSGVIYVKDGNGIDVSGICGENSDNVAFWAGGTHTNAKLGNVPVLITKTGIGSKIGPFSIGNSNISIDTLYGKINIDNQEGISIYDSMGVKRALFTGKKLGQTEKPVKEQLFRCTSSEHDYVTFNPSNYDIELQVKTIIIEHDANIVYKKFIDVKNTYDNQYDLTYRLKLILRKEDGTFVHESDAESGNYVLGINGRRCTLDFEKKVQSGTYVFCISIDWYLNGTKVNPGDYIQDWLSEAYFYSIYGNEDNMIDNIYDCVMIGTDGVLVSHTEDVLFQINSTSEEQKIIIKGLKELDDKTANGQLYKDSDGTLKIR